MKYFTVYLLAACLIAGIGLSASPADNQAGSSSDKSLTDTAREVKTEAVKVYQESKDAVVRDIHSMKEDIPRGLKEAKEAAVQQSKDAMNGATKELKEMRDNIAKPKPAPGTDGK